MANVIKLKSSGVENKVPLVSDLDTGEIALNYKDGNIYYKNSVAQIAEMKRLDARLEEMNITNMVYDGFNILTNITYESGNKVALIYTGDYITSVEYYATDGITLLFTHTLAYDLSDNMISSTWSAA